MRFGILKKFLAAFLVLSLSPLLVLSYYAREKVAEVGRSAVDSSRQALSRTAMSLLEARARAIARQVELFLDAAAGDLNSLAMLPPEPDGYLEFHRIHRRPVWVRAGNPQHPQDIRPSVPLYRELTYADAHGIERIRVTEGRLYTEGRDVSGPFRSDFGPEDYFAKARALSPGAFYVSRLVGRHLRAAEQLQGAADVESAIGGEEYRGILRFAVAVHRQGRFAGVVSLALDHRHLMEHTQHVLPIGSAEVVFPSYASGNYAFLFDDEGWIITHPKFWDIRGWDRDTGEVMDPRSPLYNEARLKDGTAPFNLLHVPFIHTNYRFIALESLDGRSGVTRTSSVGGVARVMAFAPIRFPHGEYADRGIFGGVTLGAQTEAFHRAVDHTAAGIEADLAHTVRRFWLIILVTGGAVAVIAAVLARSFTRPIRLLAHKVEQINQGRYDFAVDIIRSGDELESLGRNFQQMGRQLEKHRYNLMASMSELRASKEEIEASNRRLEAQVEMLKTLHTMGRELSVSFDRQKILDTLLRACVQGLGFERAVVYLFDEARRRLVCAKVLGFDAEVAQRAGSASYHLDRHDCLPVRVFRSGEAIMVRDVASDPSLSDLDRRMAAESRTGSFSFAPIRVADRSIGVLGADYATSARRISEEAMESLKIVANDAALALERARLMAAAVKERDFIESIFANMLSGLLVVDAHGRVQSANRKAEQLLERSTVELIGRPVNEALEPYPALLEQFRKASVGEEILPPVLEIQTPAGRQVHLETAFSCIHGTAPEAGGGATLLIFRDVTQRKKIEDHLRRSDRLVSLGTLAAGIAHEIRNPLTGISLLLDDLHDRMANRTDERLLMQSALEEIEKLEKIITELLEFAANPSSRLATRDLNKVIDHTLFFVHKQMRQQKIQLERDTPADLPPIRLDPEKMKQAVLNILLNAIKVLPDGGIIRIVTRLHESLETLDGRRALELTITDDGPGIHPDDLEYLFDPFFTRNPDGFGLGLAITHTIVEEHRGRITVENAPGGGACFRIYLPVEAEGVGNGTHPGR